MHRDYDRAQSITHDIIASAIEVHRTMGPGLLERIYERCLVHELTKRGHVVEAQRTVSVVYKDLCFSESLRCDLLVDGCVLVELKAVEYLLPKSKAQVLSYMKLLNVPVGLLMNFHELRLKDGLSRLILRGSDGNQTLAP